MMMVEEKTRNEERHKNLTENLNRALIHSHDAKVMSSSNTAAIGIIENKIEVLYKEVSSVQNSLRNIEETKNSMVRKIITTIITGFGLVVFGGVAHLIWKNIYNH